MAELTSDSGGIRDSRRRLNWRQVSVLYRRDLRSALRDRTIVINSILIPTFLFPFLIWAAFSGIMFVSGQAEHVRSRVVVEAWPVGHEKLRRAIESDKKIELVQVDRAEAARQVARGLLDAAVRFIPATGTNASFPGNFEAEIICNAARERSIAARDRIKSAVGDYRSDLIKRAARERGITAATWQGFTLASMNMASSKQMGTFLLGLLIPIIFVVMVAIGSFYPAIDAIAGERERNTWETLISSSADRLSIVTAKYFYVATVGGLAGALNLTAMLLTIKPLFAPLLAQAGQTAAFQLPFSALPLLIVAALLLAAFVAAGMMIFASFAHTFKEGQAMITPFYLCVLVPLVFLQVPGLKLSLPLSFVPVVNVTLMIRDSLSGHVDWICAGVTIFVSAALVALSLRAASFILRFEDVVLGSYRGSLAQFLKERALKRSRNDS